ncbi:NAD(P)-binding protein [Gonapodya prolifera JEL478]|uniref:NAD(P)-binding protein n=1 Tax=Gonapodya prolifera (strain JEL478) TaxID=1344416 RepID=A0A138ZYQ4_GONPJ|nr:NAD(P)-binding protein [Gonapodya prolifera JEL478]|eukprot:KXS09253.1 NAD(P)-binding protein [Gonapodya prolifera JEL478]
MSVAAVLVIGATGATGLNIVHGLAALRTSRVIALIRPSSLANPAYAARLAHFRSLGVEIRTGTTKDTEQEIRAWLKGVDIVVSTVVYSDLLSQRDVVRIAKEVGVKRFIPSDFSTHCPPGVMALQGKKDIVHKHIIESGIGYTFINTGSWFEVILQEVDGTLPFGTNPFPPRRAVTFKVVGSGDKPNAITHLPDVGNLVAKIVLDPRTLNKYVFCMAETLSMNQMGRIYEEETGTKLVWKNLDPALLLKRYKDLHAVLPPLDTDPELTPIQNLTDYGISRWIRGDNVPPAEALKSWELYPDYKCLMWREWLRSAVKNGTVEGARTDVPDIGWGSKKGVRGRGDQNL